MMKKKSACALVLTCLGATACMPSWSPFGHYAHEQDRQVFANGIYQDALLALERRDFEGALMRFQSLSRSYRESPAALNGMATAYAGLGQNTKAQFMFETALKADPFDQTAIEGLDRLFAQNAASSAPSAALAAQALNPDQPAMIAQAPSAPVITVGDLNERAITATDQTALPIVMTSVTPALVMLNGNGGIGIADRYATDLVRQNFRVAEIGRADSFDYPHTVIRFHPGLRDSALAVANAMGLVAELVEISDERGDIVVILGADAV